MKAPQRIKMSQWTSMEKQMRCLDINRLKPRLHRRPPKHATFVTPPYLSPHHQMQQDVPTATYSADAVSPWLLFKSLELASTVPDAEGNSSIPATWNSQLARA
jgi:hypothetical protein